MIVYFHLLVQPQMFDWLTIRPFAILNIVRKMFLAPKFMDLNKTFVLWYYPKKFMLFGTIQLVDWNNGGHVIQFGFGEITTCPLPPISNDDEDLSNDQEDNKKNWYQFK